MSRLDLKSLPDPGSKYKIGLKIGGGVGGEVFEAVEDQTGIKVAIKVIELKKETEDEIHQEYAVLNQMSGSENFPEFYGIYSKRGKDNTCKIWIVFELCGGGEATSLVRKLEQENKKMNELHIAYIIRETIKAAIRLHESDISHRDIRGSNVHLTEDGRVKLLGYGASKRVEGSEKTKTFVGSPSWLAPEVIACQNGGESAGYDRKADVWAVGITAIELGDGRAPFEDMHPGRALFQIVNNPPPTLRKPSDWTQLYNDFVSECLVKSPENRPFMQELLVHPFFEPLDNAEKLAEDVAALLERYKSINLYKNPEMQLRKGFLKIEGRETPEKILQEDLAAMTEVSEDSVLFELADRFKRNECQTFIGDILLILNSNKTSDVYGIQYQKKYCCKAKSQNAPHVYSVADSAYRDVFHHGKPQHVLFAGETGAGKTTAMIHATEHLLFLGRGLKTEEKVRKALKVIHALGNAATPHNPDSTRHVLQTQMTFSDTGKVSGAVFRLYLLEKERVTTAAKKQDNFHLFYHFYEYLKSEGRLSEFHMADRSYKFLKSESNTCKRIGDYREFEKALTDLGFEEEEMRSIKKTLGAVLLLGEVEFTEDEDGKGVLSSPETVENVADLLGVDKKKLSWALLNYCLIVNGEAIMRHNGKREADEIRDVLARGLYSRLVDWIVNAINEKISVSRVIYGDRHVVSLLDLYGFECYKRNTLNQLFVNTINEQLQFHYNQKIFFWEKQTAEDEGVPFPNLKFNDNKLVVDMIVSKPDGLLRKIDEATRSEDFSDLLSNLKKDKEAPVFAETSREFSINHYTGKLAYDAADIVEKNRDFLPPEVIETMRLSTETVTKQLFSSLLSKSGNLSKETGRRNSSEKKDIERNVSTTPTGQYSQSRQMRTSATTFMGACVDLFKNLTEREFGFHFVRCLRTDLSDKPGAFDPEVVRQQLRALAVVNTVLVTQQGYSYSVSHEEFIRRYKFLAFDFDENVEETKENCRLLLLRLKLEGWTMGKTKVFLKYFNREYLSRMYETQIKKIVKVQSMMRTFVARRKLCAKIRRYQTDADKNNCLQEEINEQAMEANAARIIQKRYREYASSKCNLTESQKEFIRPWYKRWRTKSIFQVLLLYRAERLQAVVNFCLQVHLYNQSCRRDVQKTKDEIDLGNVDVETNPAEYLPPLNPAIPRLLFTWESLTLRGDVNGCKPLPDFDMEQLQEEVRANLSKRVVIREETCLKNYEDKEVQTCPSTENSASQKAKISKSEKEEIPKRPTKQPPEILKMEATKPSALQTATKKEIVKKPNAPEVLHHAGRNGPTEIMPKPRRFINDTPPKPSGNLNVRVIRHRKFQTSLSEMEEKFKNKNYSEDGDEPPFNFRSLLKKTDHSTDSRRTLRDDQIFPKEVPNFPERKAPACTWAPGLISETIVTEIAPGILVYGKVADL